MHFCSECHNMYYLKLSVGDLNEDGGDVSNTTEASNDVSNKLIYYCRNCGHEDDTITNENICVSTTHIKRNEQNYTHIINEYTKYDSTLPRINTIKCPNNSCKSNLVDGAENREVIYIRYDDINMKYIYLCTVCDKLWKTNIDSA
jgi:DNA-directed RNA polymerase subunit M/transcription elongation factor TFIIS